MLTAALDTSLTCQLAIAEDNRIIYSGRLESASRDNDQKLPPWLLAVLKSLDATPADIRRWTVGTGPGSFAGLRSGISFVKGICMVTGAQLRGVPSALATAACLESAPADSRIGVVMDGRCGQVILSIVQNGRLVEAPAALDPQSLLEDEYQCNAWITPQASLLPPLPPNIQSALHKTDTLDMRALLGNDNIPWPANLLDTDKSCEPIYVRPPVFVKPLELKNLLA